MTNDNDKNDTPADPALEDAVRSIREVGESADADKPSD